MKKILMPIAVGTILGTFLLFASWEQDNVSAQKNPPVVDAEKPAAQAEAQDDANGDDEEERPLQRFMRGKLEASNQVLEGLTTEDFDLIQRGAVKLQQISGAEQWRISNDAMYRQYSAQFQRVAEQLQERAKAEELEGAALTWLEATMSCIECHRWVRATLIADDNRLDIPMPR